MTRHANGRLRKTTITVAGERWDVPFGFGREYQRIAALGSEGIRDVLELIGYTAPEEEIAAWPLRKQVEASVYAANVHARASDNILPAHPRPRWFPPEPWGGPHQGESDSIWGGPGPTPINVQVGNSGEVSP